jgi:hypothetical protein
MDKTTTGMMITKPASDSPDYPLKAWDIITAIGDQPIDNTGMVEIAPNLRLRFGYLVPRLAADGKVPLSIIREGQPTTIELPVSADTGRVLKHLGTKYPSYFIYGPLVFTPVYADHLERLSADFLAMRQSPILSRGYDQAAFEGEELVTVSSPLFPHRITKGYGVDYFPTVDTVNGVKIKNLAHLVETLRDAGGEYIVFEWADDGVEKLVFKREELLAATEEILEDNGVRSQTSDDLEAVWEGE